MAKLEQEVLDGLTEAADEVIDHINKLSDDKVISYSDYKLVEFLKDDLIICASLIALRDHGPVHAAERMLLESAETVIRNLIKFEKERA